ncbi:MAG: peptidase, partial [Armatimonadetes bacterium]|nr:peptidase [Armatimonadota bacterium]
MPIMPVADPTGLPAPIWILKFLSVFTLTLHLLAMNLLVGGVTMMALAARRAGSDPLAERVFRRLARALPVTMSMTITLGVAPLLFVQVIYGQAFYTSSVLMAWPWLMIVPLVMAAYYGLYICQFRPEWLGRLVTPVAWLSAVAILAVGFLFANNWTLMLAPHVWKDLYVGGISGFHLNTVDPSFVPRYLHFMVGAFAVGGLGVMLLARLARAGDAEMAEAMERSGRRWFLIAGGLQFVIGFWFLFALPDRVWRVFIGGGMVDSAVLSAGIVLALIAMAVVRRAPITAAFLTGLSVFLMVAVRHRVRQLMLQPNLK